MTHAIQHSHTSVEHYGPDWLPPMVREAFGGPINLDPASCTMANTLIGAERWYGAIGLERPWFGNVYLNPPGPIKHSALWYATLAYRFALGHVTQAVFMAFNPELLRYAQRWQVTQPLEFPTCWPKKRIDFWKPTPSGPVPQKQPGHCNVIVYMGPRYVQFRQIFSKLGAVYDPNIPF